MGPLIAGYIANKYDINILFLLSSIIIFTGFLLFKISKIKDMNIKKKIDGNLIKNFRDYFKNKDRTVAYFLSGGVNLWWIFIYLFMPMYIIESGLNEIWLGYFLFAVAMPLILTEYKFYNLISKIGYKKTFRIGFLIIGFCSLIGFFISNIYVIMLFLVLASFGIAMLEANTESYFFEILKDKEEENKYYGPYNTAIDSNYFVGKILSAVVLLFLPFRFLFLLYAVFMFGLILLTKKVKNLK